MHTQASEMEFPSPKVKITRNILILAQFCEYTVILCECCMPLNRIKLIVGKFQEIKVDFVPLHKMLQECFQNFRSGHRYQSVHPNQFRPV